MTAIDYLVAEEGEICLSAIGNEEDESRPRNVRSITDHMITSVLHQKQHSAKRRLLHRSFLLIEQIIEQLIKLS